jgi:anhydro-N-acetylmuramic acid kinase
MSGASLDGVDAVVATFEAPDRAYCLHHLWQPYADDLRQALLDLHHPGEHELERALLLSNRLAEGYAEATACLLRQAGIPPTAIQAIGCHGQTLRHRPAEGLSLQLNQPARLAELTGITVVADFLSRDIAAGGQGSPICAAFLAENLRSSSCHRVLVKIGGMASITDLPPEGPVRGFDCGPGTLVMDAWVKRQWGCDYDPAGSLAAQGRVLEGLLQVLLVHPYFALSPPKSASRGLFAPEWLERELTGREREEDVLATLLQLTVRCIANGIRNHCPGAQEVWLYGGGAHNEHLVKQLGVYLPSLRIDLTERLGLSVDGLEACAMAWLARRTLLGQPGNLAEATGARGPRILGAIYPA